MDRAQAIADMQLGRVLGDDLRQEVQDFAVQLQYKLRMERKRRIKAYLAPLLARFSEECQEAAEKDLHEYSTCIQGPNFFAIDQWNWDAMVLLPDLLCKAGLKGTTARVVEVPTCLHPVIQISLSWAIAD
eukprot:TRINITY_DN36924_c0_g1_i1.p1 TRINITY_DN36924_c0_g1~~TRINITY_DN36924_c0_g1_i1.p1  ORF type:complete len:130 (+),score=38.66 TRINITY_DN36924_c0_g1_i1:64-453(+)